MTTGAYSVNVPAMQQGASSLLGTVQKTLTTVQEFEQLIVDVMAFMQIGSPVGSANSTMQGHQTTAVNSLMQGMQKVGQLIQDVQKAYSDADSTVAKGFGDQQNAQNGQTQAQAQPQTPTSTDPILQTAGQHHYGDSGTDVTNLQNQLNAAGYPVGTADGQWGLRTTAALAQYAHDHNLTVPTQAGQLDHRVTDAIMTEEGDNPNYTQGGLHEIYGIRSNHAGYTALHDAQTQWGVGSAGERAAAAQIMQNDYNAGGYGAITDPGAQGVIMSSTHMRGTGGTRAILNAMAAGGQPNYADTTLGATTASTLNQLTPQQFQQQFHDMRESYDLRQYIDGGTVAHGAHGNIDQGRYWHGLQERYDREQTQYLNMSNGQ